MITTNYKQMQEDSQNPSRINAKKKQKTKTNEGTLE